MKTEYTDKKVFLEYSVVSKLIINGGNTLFGDIRISGSKNAALPIIFSTLVLRGVSVIYSAPRISDVEIAIQIIEQLGAKCRWVGDALYIDTRELEYRKPSDDLTSKIRASSYLLGACLSRFGVVDLCSFGGCNFENRPIDMHIEAALTVGGRIDNDRIVAEELVGKDILFNKVSVGATVNAILLSVRAKGRCRIFNYAKEPHILSLISFLRTAGAKIEIYDKFIEVDESELKGGVVSVIPDMIEAGTYLALSLATGSSLNLIGAPTRELKPFFDLLTACGANVEIDGRGVRVFGEMTTPCKIITAPYPAFPTDLQPQMAPLIARFSGGEIVEGVWRGRFGYLSMLSRFGVSYELSTGGAKILPSRLRPASVVVPDLRGGAALLIASLCCKGESEIHSAEILGRGYEDLVKKLSDVNANITEI